MITVTPSFIVQYFGFGRRHNGFTTSGKVGQYISHSFAGPEQCRRSRWNFVCICPGRLDTGISGLEDTIIDLPHSIWLGRLCSNHIQVLVENVGLAVEIGTYKYINIFSKLLLSYITSSISISIDTTVKSKYVFKQIWRLNSGITIDIILMSMGITYENKIHKSCNRLVH